MPGMMYHPPRFGLLEFDEVALRPVRQGRRRFVGWNGLAARPAEEVTLAWSAPGAGVLVATSGQAHADVAEVRLAAAHLALAGDVLPIAARPASVTDAQHEIARIAQAQELWSPGPVLTAGGRPAEVAMGDGFAVAYGRAGRLTVLMAAAGVPPSGFRVRPVRDWGPYGMDATKTYPVSELERLAWHRGD